MAKTTAQKERAEVLYLELMRGNVKQAISDALYRCRGRALDDETDYDITYEVVTAMADFAIAQGRPPTSGEVYQITSDIESEYEYD